MFGQGILALALTFGGPLLEPNPDAHRQFDFWIGEWSVQNRHLSSDGTWSDGDVTRARITPVLGGRALLEEWAGPFRNNFMNGFSLRAYDPQAERWVIVLFWTTDGNATFGRMRGAFRHGRGEFIAPEGGVRQTRYTFSDALPESVRWDSAATADGGRTWSTDWIMEFSRTRPAIEVTDAELFATGWNEGRLSPHREARALDWMLGTWQGIAEEPGAVGTEREARLRCRLLGKDCLVLDVLETRAPEAETWTGSLNVRGYVAANGTWESWGLSTTDTRLRPAVGRPEDDGMRFERTDPATGAVFQRSLVPLGEGRMRIEEVAIGAGDAEAELLWTALLERTD